MKKIVQFNKKSISGVITLDRFNPEFKSMEEFQILNEFLPYTKIFEKVVIKNYSSISQDLASRLCHQYIHGAEVVIANTLKRFEVSFVNPQPKEFYEYKFVELNLSKPCPKSLAEFPVKYKGIAMSFIEFLRQWNSTRYLPNDIFTQIDDYNQSRIAKCREHNQGDFADIEKFLFDISYRCAKQNIKVFSPNKKTFYEVSAQIKFDDDCENCRLNPNEKPLADQQVRFLNKYAKAYGIEIPQFMWRYNTRKTDNGYTQEIERVHCPMSTYDRSRIAYDSRNYKKGTLLPGFVRRGLNVQMDDNDKLLLEAFKQLKWLIEHMGDEALMPHYHRCPICGIYHDHDGCECGANPPIEEVQANNLFYGESSSYEDYDETISAYEDLTEEFDELFD